MLKEGDMSQELLAQIIYTYLSWQPELTIQAI